MYLRALAPTSVIPNRTFLKHKEVDPSMILLLAEGLIR